MIEELNYLSQTVAILAQVLAIENLPEDVTSRVKDETIAVLDLMAKTRKEEED